MNEYKQQLSALLDGELSGDEIRRLQPSVEAEKYSTTSRYQMIAAAMRGGDVSLVDVGHQVRVAILQEAKLEKTHTASAAKAGWFGLSWLHPAGGMAVAASVALVLVLAVSITGESPDNTSLVASQSPGQYSQVIATPVMAQQQMVLPVNNDVRPNLNSYLKAHSEFAAQDTAQGRMPYARAVTYESRN